MHGDKGGAPRGERNGNYRLGGRSIELRLLLLEARLRLDAMYAIIRAETRFQRRAEVRRYLETLPDGRRCKVTEVKTIDAYVWREGGAERAARAISALMDPSGSARCAPPP